MNTIEDLRKYIKIEYGIDPVSFDSRALCYHSIEFMRNTGSALSANQETSDMWTIKRKGHSVDFFRTDELLKAVNISGSLLYYFIPESRN